VVVVWGGEHPEWLAAAVRSIDAQVPAPAERCLVVDSDRDEAIADARDAVRAPGGWVVRQGCWREPAAARNEGVADTSSAWVVFWDADNIMPPGFLAAAGREIHVCGGDIGIVYSDIQYINETGQRCGLWRVPDWDYWTLRKGNYIDTAAAWRREALELAGGWPGGFESHEDYALALEITRRGWQARRREGPPIVKREHPASRTAIRQRNGGPGPDLWQARSLGIVSLLAGRASTYERWETFLRTAELPRHTALYVVDNSGDPEFTGRVHRTCRELAVRRQLEHVSVSVRAERYIGQANEDYFTRQRHLHIARLYADALPAAREDLVLTLEDDVEPSSDAIRRLAEQFPGDPGGNRAAVGAAYDMGDGTLCAGRADGGWGSPIYWHQVTDQPMDVGSIGGGCTLWANWALAGQPVSFLWGQGLGWDGSLCAALRKRGYRLLVHGGVRCTHHIHGAIRAQ
jgi:glycosyltransferase involved in cell wall biosynthesis